MVIVIDSQIAGISGDMLLSSLINLGANKEKIISGIKTAENLLDDSTIKKIDFENVKKHGILATGLILDVEEDFHDRKGIDIKSCIESTCEKLELSPNAKIFATKSIDTLIDAESKIHGEEKNSVHFHEAASIDTVVDILGCAIALDDLNFFHDEIICTPVAVGGGTVSFSHGTTSNPASAILEMFQHSKIIISGGQTKSELTTPTGACMLVNLASSCTEYYPTMQVTNVGYGAGTKDFEGFSNVLKIIVGKKTHNFTKDSVKILETNIDDVSGELLGSLIEKIMIHGAKDVTISSALTKKGRPTNLVTIICDLEHANSLLDLLVEETGTLGVRIRTSERMIVPREIQTINVTLMGNSFKVNFKQVNQLKTFKIESDDIKHISSQINKSFRKTEELIRIEIQKMLK